MTARMFLNGVEVTGGFGRIEFDGKRLEHDKPRPSAPRGVTSGSYVLDIENVNADALQTWIDSLEPRAGARAEGVIIGRGGNTSTAGFDTLGRRYFYGGRKGRRARRRMIDGVFGPTRVQLEPTEHAALAFACPFPFFKAKE